MNILQKRQESLPIIHVKGSHYEIGYNVGRTFCGLIKTLTDTHPSLNNEYIPLYNTEKGKIIYDEIYECVMKYFPQYIRELKGLSDGAEIPFHKLFLLHIDDVLPGCIESKSEGTRNDSTKGSLGCSSICLNGKDEILGHTEDGFKEVINNFYILNAEITESEPAVRFTAFCYAGLLPGYAMGFNKYGLVYSINIVNAKHLGWGRLPRTFVTRALLEADSIDTALRILACKGCGIADAMSVNLTFLHEAAPRVFYNIEISPNSLSSTESALSIAKIFPGQDIFHTNKFLHLNIPEIEGTMMESSNARQQARERHKLLDKNSVLNLLGDTSNPKFSIFRSTERVWTLAVGIFDCKEKTWAIYLGNPKMSNPLVVIPME